MATPVQKNLEEKNAEYASTFKEGHLPLPPAKHYAIVTCMDARIHPPAQLGISLGDAHIIRNAGGSARDALRSLIISQQLLGTTEVLVIKHTGCGMLTFKNEDAHAVVKKQLGEEAAGEVKGLDFLPFGDLEGAVREDVEFLRGSRAIGGGGEGGKVVVSGWVYEVEGGRVRKVV